MNVLSPFAPGAAADEKLRLAFTVYDFDKDGKLGREDLHQLLTLLLPDGTDGDILDKVIQFTIEEADKDGDGALDYVEFKQAVKLEDLLAKLTIAF